MAGAVGTMNRRAFLVGANSLTCLAVLGGESISLNASASKRGTPTSPVLARLHSPVLFNGDARTAYRDPAAVYRRGWFYIYFTLVRTERDEVSYSYVAWSKSNDLTSWTEPKILTPRDKQLDYGSPGDVVRVDRNWVMCLQTYPRPHGEKYGNGSARIWTMTSRDLENWEKPELIEVKGPKVAPENMGRMIDPFLLQDKDQTGKWWCFYKQHGISISWSNDLVHWTPFGRADAGENPCVIVDRGEYVLFHSPANGVGVKRSTDLVHWREQGLLTLGQADWDWARGRLTAGFVLDLRKDSSIGKALMFFHGSSYAEDDMRGGFDNFASIGLAWSDDLVLWEWPGSQSRTLKG